MSDCISLLREFILEARANSGDFKKGDDIVFGKYKNKRGKIIDIFLDDNDHVTLTIQPVSKGRKKKNVEMGLYKIWHDDD